MKFNILNQIQFQALLPRMYQHQHHSFLLPLLNLLSITHANLLFYPYLSTPYVHFLIVHSVHFRILCHI